MSDGRPEPEEHPAPETDAADAAAPPVPDPSVAGDPVLGGLADAFPRTRFGRFAPRAGPDQDYLVVERDDYHALVEAVRDAGFDVFADLCGVDYLRRRPRFEVVLNVLSHELRRRLRIHVGVPSDDPTVASVTDVYAGANFFEREAFDLFGIVFEGHPDLTRILMPDDWEGYPLRKDYGVGSVPVQFKGAHKAS